MRVASIQLAGLRNMWMDRAVVCGVVRNATMLPCLVAPVEAFKVPILTPSHALSVSLSLRLSVSHTHVTEYVTRTV